MFSYVVRPKRKNFLFFDLHLWERRSNIYLVMANGHYNNPDPRSRSVATTVRRRTVFSLINCTSQYQIRSHI